MDVNSDYESSDMKEFTEARLEMKRMRIQRRNEVVPQLKLCQLKQNSGIVSDFQKYLRNLRFSSSSEDDARLFARCLNICFFTRILYSIFFMIKFLIIIWRGTFSH